MLVNKDDKNYCRKYHNNSLLLMCLGAVWMLSAVLGTYDKRLSILVLFVGVAIISPVMGLIRKSLSIPYVNEEHPARMTMKCLTIAIPFGMIAGFFPFVENMNVFYPVFMLIFGITFGMIGILFNLKSYGVVAAILIAAGFYILGFHSEKFLAGGYLASGIMILGGIISRYTESSPAPALKVTFDKRTTADLKKAA